MVPSYVGSSLPAAAVPAPAAPAAAANTSNILEPTIYVGGNAVRNLAAFLRASSLLSTVLVDESSSPDALVLRPALHAATLALLHRRAGSVGDAPSARTRTSPWRRRQAAARPILSLIAHITASSCRVRGERKLAASLGAELMGMRHVLIPRTVQRPAAASGSPGKPHAAASHVLQCLAIGMHCVGKRGQPSALRKVPQPKRSGSRQQQQPCRPPVVSCL